MREADQRLRTANQGLREADERQPKAKQRLCRATNGCVRGNIQDMLGCCVKDCFSIPSKGVS